MEHRPVFPTQLGLPILKFLQEELEEPNDIQRRIFQIIEVQQIEKSSIRKLLFTRTRLRKLLIRRQKRIFLKKEILC
jgi:hypothetical protein